MHTSLRPSLAEARDRSTPKIGLPVALTGPRVPITGAFWRCDVNEGNCANTASKVGVSERTGEASTLTGPGLIPLRMDCVGPTNGMAK